MFETKIKTDANGTNGKNAGGNGNGSGKGMVKINELFYKMTIGLKIRPREKKGEKTTGMKDQTATSLETATLAVESIMKTNGISAPPYKDVEKVLAKGFLGC